MKRETKGKLIKLTITASGINIFLNNESRAACKLSCVGLTEANWENRYHSAAKHYSKPLLHKIVRPIAMKTLCSEENLL